MKSIKLALAALILPAPLLAGSLTPPADPVVVTPAAPAPVAVGGDWTGGYAGVQLGYGNYATDPGTDSDGFIYGAHAGYDYDFGQFILGGEVDIDAGDLQAAGGDVDNIARAKLRAGYDLGRTMVYATGGAARVTGDFGDDTGWTAGLGMSYAVTDNFLVGAEALTTRFDDVGGSDLNANTLGLRASFKF
ncbi:outer membrane protein [Mesobacterium pallidum]|uniref:outer membrane protein n=1 Tax=Mesobacterium pallidum TaxID=2872037 RepID=UPI001EE23023|nr:outer membrane beta-barrel protein [Mesobacterium pallidum]